MAAVVANSDLTQYTIIMWWHITFQ